MAGRQSTACTTAGMANGACRTTIEQGSESVDPNQIHRAILHPSYGAGARTCS